ncbi:copper-binding protein [Kouleothrix aurantiaca]|uniref:Copper-binding protein n=1 Tax=Kouleothrix aurantiaca TaxID=186479 RepID=A0A0N8PSH1_9CHLR|nr:copper-binding protein [Kouleothrix aurantiaca]
METEQLLVPEISCNHCVRAISDAVNALPGVQLVTVDLAGKTVRVAHDRRTDLAAIMGAINEAGYEEIAVLT